MPGNTKRGVSRTFQVTLDIELDGCRICVLSQAKEGKLQRSLAAEKAVWRMNADNFCSTSRLLHIMKHGKIVANCFLIVTSSCVSHDICKYQQSIDSLALAYRLVKFLALKTRHLH